MNLVKVLSTTAFLAGGCITIRNQHRLLKADESQEQMDVRSNSPISEEKRRVAVVGSGIGAASTVYFLRYCTTYTV